MREKDRKLRRRRKRRTEKVRERNQQEVEIRCVAEQILLNA